MNEETLFAEALSRSPEERAAFLDQACAGRPELRAAVEALLAAHERSGNILDGTPAETVDSGPDQARPDATSDHAAEPDDESATSTKTFDYGPMSGPGFLIAGRYTLQEKIGEGGMGEVWVAKQTEPVKRKVALKLIKTGMDSKAVLQRFDQERQALALMDHPNIAKVLDGGLTPTGQPFFVMELVNGLPLTKFCDEARLTTKERLELFVAICQAVQHAHQKGIVHRDRKPANILVTMIDGKPVPKVIDFGVAKATAGKLTDVSLSTQFGAVVGTLEYMSPEQAGFSGEDIDTRADIYSLGVILYELLTGLRPIDAKRLKKAALTEMIRIIREEEPAKPSTRLSTDESLPSMAALRHTDPRKLMALLRGELDWVVMKCLEKHRDRRYETANGLARDIQRYLADEAVEARPPSAGYRLSKFLKRHKGKVIAASLVLLALVAGMAGTTWGLIREARANAALAAKNGELSVANGRVMKANADLSAANSRVEARYNFAFDAIKTFHTGVSEDFLLKQDQFKALRDRLLKSAADFYGKLGALLGKESDPAARRALASSNFELADLAGKVGRPEEALAAHRAVLAAREALAAEPGAGAALKVDLGQSLTAVASLLEATGKADEAVTTYRRSESLLAGLAGGDPATRAALADCRARLGTLLGNTGGLPEALTAFRQARADQQALADAPGATEATRRDLAMTLRRISWLLSEKMGQRKEAEAETRRALTLWQELADDNPAVLEYRYNLARDRGNFGLMLRRTGKQAEAEVEYRKTGEALRKLVEEYPAVTDFRRSLATLHSARGTQLMEAGKSAESEAQHRAGLALQQELVDDYPAVEQFRVGLAYSRINLGILLSWTRPAEAEGEFRRAIAIFQKLADDNPRNVVYRQGLFQASIYLGKVARALGREVEGRDLLERTTALVERLAREVPSYRFQLALLSRQRGLVFGGQGDHAAAAAHARRALELYAAVPSTSPSSSATFETACCRAELAGLAGRPGSGVSAADATAEADAAMALLRKAVGMGLRNPAQYNAESALAPLRDRPDFRLLMMDVAFPTDPLAAAR
jgi:serine/threonine protein kinase